MKSVTLNDLRGNGVQYVIKRSNCRHYYLNIKKRGQTAYDEFTRCGKKFLMDMVDRNVNEDLEEVLNDLAKQCDKQPRTKKEPIKETIKDHTTFAVQTIIKQMKHVHGTRAVLVKRPLTDEEILNIATRLHCTDFNITSQLISFTRYNTPILVIVNKHGVRNFEL